MAKNSDPNSLLMRVEEAANALGVSRAYVYELISSGALPTVKLGSRAVRIPRKALQEWVDTNTIFNDKTDKSR